MVLLLAGVLFSGVIADQALYHLGLRDLLLRYLSAVSLAYLAFFGMIRLWCWLLFRGAGRSFDDSTDLILRLNPFDFTSGSISSAKDAFKGGGGGSGGAGASASWDDAGPLPVARNAAMASELSDTSALASDSDSFSPGDLTEGDGDAGVVALLFVLLLAVICGGGIYLIWNAPQILSDAAFQVALAAGLLRGSRRLRNQGWAGSVFEHTWVAFALILLCTLLAGAAARLGCRSASTMQEVLQQCRARRATSSSPRPGPDRE